jgi:hypothetical protein
MDTSHIVAATFVERPTFTDLTGSASDTAIVELAARGIVHGYGDGRYGPDDMALRAQVAGLLTRALGWTSESHPTSFSDQGAVDTELWRSVGTLAYYGVAQGYGDGTFGPTDQLLHAQTISLISRAMVARGYWTAATSDDPAIYPNVPASSGHRLDLVTFVHNAGPIPDRPTANGAPWTDWDGAASRGWFARVLWLALTATLGVNHGP